MKTIHAFGGLSLPCATASCNGTNFAANPRPGAFLDSVEARKCPPPVALRRLRGTSWSNRKGPTWEGTKEPAPLSPNSSSK